MGDKLVNEFNHVFVIPTNSIGRFTRFRRIYEIDNFQKIVIFS